MGVGTDFPDKVEGVVGGGSIDDEMRDRDGLGIDTFKAVTDG